MAQIHASRPGAASENGQQGGGLQRATYLVGAISSLALVIGMTVWGVRTMTRDVSGVPVVKAAAGPMRIAPEEPGGQQAQHQGFSVNDVAAAGTAADPADRLILAPEPLDLSFEEAPVVAEAEAMQDDTEEGAEAVAAVETDDAATMNALADALAEGVEPLETVQPAAMEVEAPVRADGSLARSLRPKVRPASLGAGTRPTEVIETAAQAGEAEEVDAESIPVGTRLAQLGAFTSEEIAREEWTRLAARFGDYLDGKSRVIQRAQSGGRTFYRLRAMGFDDLADARRFCSALVSERAECIPVVTR
ncbi:SPOR domain-containing protein [Roseovarius sp. SCSIO 43702]|uniref:SPOR domain-containing protein n=1 Tax=Roseovarius sp. SCSIO 43702 TaxID=2823043 RepID=UPI001C733344|nr:SPOR domain-containing protein [Roseovarius sp. SCSIO 43702]QYX55251.1 SPOR domain-containing protein [Roseovarius sp. SCSIO 43702]